MIITKLDAARRQIDTAIALNFDEGDAVSIDALVGAAQLLIGDLSKAAQQETLIERYIRPERRAEFVKATREPQNFVIAAQTSKKEFFSLCTGS